MSELVILYYYIWYDVLTYLFSGRIRGGLCFEVIFARSKNSDSRLAAGYEVCALQLKCLVGDPNYPAVSIYYSILPIYN
jgi:hypothetical protein